MLSWKYNLFKRKMFLWLNFFSFWFLFIVKFFFVTLWFLIRFGIKDFFNVRVILVIYRNFDFICTYFRFLIYLFPLFILRVFLFCSQIIKVTFFWPTKRKIWAFIIRNSMMHWDTRNFDYLFWALGVIWVYWRNFERVLFWWH